MKTTAQRHFYDLIVAAGDVRDSSTKQVVSAAGEGSTADLEIRAFLKQG